MPPDAALVPMSLTLRGSGFGTSPSIPLPLQPPQVEPLGELANNVQWQEVWLVDHLVELERVGLIVVRPFDELVHLGHRRPRQSHLLTIVEHSGLHTTVLLHEAIDALVACRRFRCVMRVNGSSRRRNAAHKRKDRERRKQARDQ